MEWEKIMLMFATVLIVIGIYNGVNAQIGGDSSIVERGEPTIDVDGNNVDVTMHLYNPGTTSSGNVLFELQLRTEHWPLAVVGPQQTCNPSYPWNVHRMVNLASGEQEDVTLSSTRDDGKYHLYLVSVDKCCVDQSGNEVYPPCQDKSPYGLYGRYIGTIKIGDDGGQIPPNNPFQFLIDYWYIFAILIVMIAVGAGLWLSGGGKK